MDHNRRRAVLARRQAIIDRALDDLAAGRLDDSQLLKALAHKLRELGERALHRPGLLAPLELGQINSDMDRARSARELQDLCARRVALERASGRGAVRA